MSRKLKDNLNQLLDRVGLAAARVGRRSDRITTVAVTKTVGLKAIRKLIDLGHLDLGENRVQQLVERAANLADRTGPNGQPPRWHMIGHLQRNKVRPVLGSIHWLHSLDSLRLAEEISGQAARMDRPVHAFLQVNASGEKSKSGVAVGAATHLIEQIRTLPHIRIIGLMTMAPLVDDPEKVRPIFARTRELFEEIEGEKLAGSDFRHLSMGMSQDFEVAIQEGATVIRIGTALFAGVS
jgi:pyridoxal phosphate enzyme (YggS family)